MDIEKAKIAFAAEISAAATAGGNYAEIDESGEAIHFCTVVDNSTPLDWSWGPECSGFWI